VESGQGGVLYSFIFIFFPQWRIACHKTGEAAKQRPKNGGDMKSKLFAVLLLAGSSLFAALRGAVGIGVGVGIPAPAYAPPPAPAVGYVAPAPGRGYAWLGGYWYPNGARWAWCGGYWADRPYAHAYWVAPRYNRHRYYRGYWRR
jgi:hypothetical protein